MNKNFQIIYVLTNPAMPGLVKIGNNYTALEFLCRLIVLLLAK